MVRCSVPLEGGPRVRKSGHFHFVLSDAPPAVSCVAGMERVPELLLRHFMQEVDAAGAWLRVADARTGQIVIDARAGSFADEPMAQWAPDFDAIRSLCSLAPPVAMLGSAEGGDLLDIPFHVGSNLFGVLRGKLHVKNSSADALGPAARSLSHLAACALGILQVLDRHQSQYQDLILQTEKFAALGRMAAGVAHEINNPLAGILLHSTALASQLPAADPRREALDVIVEETVRCRGILKDLLEFSRVSRPCKRMADINAVITKAASILENELRLRRIQLDLALSSDIGPLFLDEMQMEQVLVNLLINAAEAIGKDGAVQVCSRVDPAEERLVVQVRDTGVGIPVEHQSQIFEPFFSTKDKGTGLGLAVSYGIIRNHHGCLRTVKTPGWSTCFSIEIPAVRTPEETPQEVQAVGSN